MHDAITSWLACAVEDRAASLLEHRMSYLDASLVPGETVVYQTRLHWIVMLRHLLLGALLLAGSGALLSFLLRQPRSGNTNEHFMEAGAAALLVCGIAAVIAGIVRRNATEMAVTTRRVIVKQGLASRKTIEMLLNKIETIEVSEPMAGRMWGYGSITIVGTGGTSEPFHRIAHPLQFRSEVQQQLERLLAGPASANGVASAAPARSGDRPR
jgi:uncharacterized membrane protein YdbT with pleckstrin-like domain